MPAQRRWISAALAESDRIAAPAPRCRVARLPDQPQPVAERPATGSRWVRLAPAATQVSQPLCAAVA